MERTNRGRGRVQFGPGYGDATVHTDGGESLHSDDGMPPQQQIHVPKRRRDIEASNLGEFPSASASREPGPAARPVPTPLPTPGATPRGCRFPSLDAAHRNITGKSFNSTSSHDRSSSSNSSTLANDATAPTGPRSHNRARKDSAAWIQDDLDPYEPPHGPIEDSAGGRKDIPLQDLSPTGVRLSTVEESNTPETGECQLSRNHSVKEGLARHGSLNQSSERDLRSVFHRSRSSLPLDNLPKQTTSMSEDRFGSGSTVDRIYDQYHTSSDPGTPSGNDSVDRTDKVGKVDRTDKVANAPNWLPFPHSSSQAKLSPSDLSELRAKAAARCGFRSDDGDESFDFSRHADNPFASSQDALADGRRDAAQDASCSRWPRPLPPGEAPSFSLPQVPADNTVSEIDGAQFHGSFHALSMHQSITTSLSDSQGLLNGEFGGDGPGHIDDHDLYPLPLMVPAQPARPANKSPVRKSYLSAGATSVCTTAESDDDPFKYDKGSYGVFVASQKEREVSAALHLISSASRNSPEKGSPLRNGMRPPPIPDYHKSQAAEYAKNHPDESQNEALRFLAPGVVRSALEINETHCTVKVPVLPPPGAASRMPQARRQPPLPPHALTEKRLKGALGDRREFGASMVSGSDRDEWETVPTAQGPLDSVGVSFRNGRNGKTGGGVIKTTGSSIADIDDDDQSSVWQAAPFDEFGSTDRIIQHPPKDGAGHDVFKIRHLKETAMPVFVPKQRVHKVNGFAQNSSRILAEAGSKPPLACGANPFNLLNKTRKHHQHAQLSSFDAGRGEPKGDGGRFKFRDSRCSSDLEKAAVGKRSNDRHRGNNEMRAVDEGHEGEKSGQFEQAELEPVVDRASGDHDLSRSSADSTTHNFSFALIPLPEAARLQKLRRMSGQDDPSEIFGDCARRDSIRTTKKTKGSTLVGAFVNARLPRVPENVHRRVPTPLYGPEAARFGTPNPEPVRSSSPLSSNFGSSPERSNTWRSLYDDSTVGFGASPTRGRGRCGRDGGQRRQYPGKRVRQTPHLYPRDAAYRHQQHRQQLESDGTFRVVADLGLAQGSLPLTYMSREGQSKQRLWFIMMLILCIFPFMSVLIYFGQFDSALSWYTKGEVNRLSRTQRRVILIMMILQFFVWPPVIVLVVKKVGGKF